MLDRTVSSLEGGKRSAGGSQHSELIQRYNVCHPKRLSDREPQKPHGNEPERFLEFR